MKRYINAYLAAFRGLPRDVWLLSAVIFINRSGMMVLTFLPLYLTLERGFDLIFAGQVLSAYGAGHLLGGWIGGWFSDRIGALRIQFSSLLISGMGYLVMERLTSAGSLLFIALLIGIAAEAFRPANASSLAAFAPPALRTRAVALNRMALNLGFAVGPALGGFLALYSYSWLFWVDGVTCIAASFLLRYLFRHRWQETTSASAEGDVATHHGCHPLKDRPFLAFTGLTVVAAFCFFQCWSTFPVFLNEVYGLDTSHFGLLLSWNAFLILAFEMILTHRSERFHPLAVAGFGFFLLPLGLALLPLGKSFLFAFAVMSVISLGEMLGIPAAGGWVANRASVVHRGKYMGIHTMAWGAAFIVAPGAGTWIYQHHGPNLLWGIVGLLGIVVWAGFLLLKRYSCSTAASPCRAEVEPC